MAAGEQAVSWGQCTGAPEEMGDTQGIAPNPHHGESPQDRRCTRHQVAKGGTGREALERRMLIAVEKEAR